MPRRCAFGCSPGPTLHRFPDANRFPERFKNWVNRVGGKLETSSDYEYYKKKMVCDIHFTESDRNRNKRLNALAIPSLHLSGQIVNDSEIERETQDNIVASTSHKASSSVILQHTVTGQIVNDSEIERETQDNIVASTSHKASSSVILQHTVTGQIVNEGEIERETPENIGDLTFHKACSTAISQDTATDYHQSLTAHQQKVVLEHNYSIIDRAAKPLRKKEASMRKSVLFTRLNPLYTKIKYLRTEISRIRKKGQLFKTRLENAEKMLVNPTFNYLVHTMTRPAQLFVHMQQQTGKKPKGRRFTIDEKILSLSLYKKSPKCYALLCNFFTLPSIKAMKRMLSEIKLCSGINPIIFNKIKDTIREKDITDRLCSLIFDEMSLTPQVFYDSLKDCFEGFATNNPKELSNHALVFMIKGVKKKFKQPVAYYFTSKLNKSQLKNIIKEVITACQNTGLIILNTVCDQSTVNVSAITELVADTKAAYLRNGKEWRNDLFRVNGRNIIPLYDTPHLIKGIRNNLMTKDMLYTINNEDYVVKWEYFQMVYKADKNYGELRLLDKITEEHINPEKINKLRVKLATQLFSHSVAVATEHLTARGDLPMECKQIIKITLLLDNLFDSLNVSSFLPLNGKKYKGAVKQHSDHHQLWRDAKLILKTLKFREIKSVGNKHHIIEKVVPSVTNLIKTIQGMEDIWQILSQKYGFDTFFTRNLNQDPIENFFGSIRSYGARNNSPNSISFQGAYKALLLNNYNTPHSTRANCEEDTNTCLQSLKFFLTENIETSDVPHENEIICNEEIFNMNLHDETDAGQRNYVCGWVVTKCLKNVKGCKKCKQDLIEININEHNTYIAAKEYSKKKWLCYPNRDIANSFQELQHMAVSFLKKDVVKTNVKKNIIAVADLLTSYPFKCPLHKEKLELSFKNNTLNVILHSWCRSINRILSGKLKYDGDDQIKNMAQEYYNKHKHYKNKI